MVIQTQDLKMPGCLPVFMRMNCFCRRVLCKSLPVQASSKSGNRLEIYKYLSCCFTMFHVKQILSPEVYQQNSNVRWRNAADP